MQASDVPHTGLDAVLGLRVTSLETDRVTASLPVSPQVLGGDGTVHRGVLCSAVESIASIAAAARVHGRAHVVGVANTTSHFASASTGDLAVVAEPVDVQQDRQLWTVRVTDEAGLLLAQGNVELVNIRDAGALGA